MAVADALFYVQEVIPIEKQDKEILKERR